MARYLLDVELTPELIQRYRDANSRLFPEPHSPIDLAVVSWIRRYPRTLPLLDAVMALLRPTGLLRGKLVAMAAILETTPHFADHYAPQAAGPARSLLTLIAHGVRAVVCLLGGLALYATVVRPTAALRLRD